ncbi:MAG: flagellar biosynthesis protein FlhA [Myxococcales bacterium]
MATSTGFMGSARAMIAPLGVVSIVVLMVLPLPAVLLDFLLALNITIALVILLTAIQLRKALDFSVFPSVLLVTTLFRLALNISSTRLILLKGEEGTEAAGQIINTFGNFVVGGSYVVGSIIFLILVIINFVVITKGSGRIAEVSARFTLDALPGKQMSIDSDLAAGLITQDEARGRREDLAREADFYGAMDGASKFVRGDAVAGLIITALNIVGGLIIGVLIADMSFGDAARTYTILTIGDGLVSQIPALLISTAAGIVVTRAADDRELGGQFSKQLLKDARVMNAGAIVTTALGLVPGMPLLPFLGLAGAMAIAGRTLAREQRAPEALREAAALKPSLSEEDQIADMLPIEALELEVGYALVPLVDAREGGELVKRIAGLRRSIATELGIILPPVHLRDNLELASGEYRLLIHGVEAARGTVMPDRLMAMDPGDAREKVDGIATTEPAFGLPALWIRPTHRARAEVAGYTVVEPATVVITHVSEAIHRDAEQLLGREDLQRLLEVVASRAPKVVEELIPTVLSHAELLAVLRALLRERVSIRDLKTVLEVLAEASRYGKAVSFLVDQVRQRLGPAIVQALLGGDGKLKASILDASSEDLLRGVIVRTDNDAMLAPDLQTAQQLLAGLQRLVETANLNGVSPILLAPPDLRYPLWRFANRFLPQLVVLSQRELPPRVEVNTLSTVSIAQARTPAALRPRTQAGA